MLFLEPLGSRERTEVWILRPDDPRDTIDRLLFHPGLFVCEENLAPLSPGTGSFHVAKSGNEHVAATQVILAGSREAWPGICKMDLDRLLRSVDHGV